MTFDCVLNWRTGFKSLQTKHEIAVTRLIIQMLIVNVNIFAICIYFLCQITAIVLLFFGFVLKQITLKYAELCDSMFIGCSRGFFLYCSVFLQWKFFKVTNVKVEFCKNVILVILIKQRSFFVLLFLFDIPIFKRVLIHSLVACIYTLIHHLDNPERYYLQGNAKNSNEVD